ncbi:MAG: toll/interleukin-1 receptor domain-containing protein [Chloroflexi bacterium]|nr:toll/interleukin-1 receptor domain-containing protein [Chloroflexota bacterium]
MISLFFSYSHKDEDLRNELETHLALLKRQGIISAWHDRRIIAGSEINQIISLELETSQIILLLVSAHFLASDYCYEKEMKRAIEKHQDGTAVVIPVILHPCDWQSAPFGSFRATPTDGKPVSMFANQQEAFSIIAKDIREAANQFITTSPTKNYESLENVVKNIKPIGDRSSNLRIKRKFDDRERDDFLENSFEYIARYFANSLEELSGRNPQIKTRFKRLDETSFSTIIYDRGDRVTQCIIWYGKRNTGIPGIYYSITGEFPTNSYNEALSLIDAGNTLQLKPLGFQMIMGHMEESLSQQGAAEYYWSILIRPLQ